MGMDHDIGRVKEARGPVTDVQVEFIRRLDECRLLLMEVMAGDAPGWDPVDLLVLRYLLDESSGKLEMGLNGRQQARLRAEAGDPLAEALLRVRR